MNAYEFLKTHKGVMEQLQTLPVQPSDVRYLELYNDYQRLTSEGHKKPIYCSISRMNTTSMRGQYIEL